MADETKIGVFLCSGCGIGDAIDVDDLMEVAGEAGAAVCKKHACLCDPEGVELIKTDIGGEELNRVVVAACSHRVMTQQFNFGPDMFVDRVNLREGVAWSHEPNDEDTQMMAQDYVRMGVAKVENGDVPHPELPEINHTVMVVGGGVAGLNSAKAAAAVGKDVVLVEKEDKLGGWAAKFTKVFPTGAPWTDLEQSSVYDLVKDVEASDKITVLTGCTVDKTDGAPGMFNVTIGGKQAQELVVGSIVQATGFRPYDPEKLGHLGYGLSPDVVTNVQVEELFSNGGFKRPSNGQVPKSVTFIQCAGSRDADHLPYCSTVCCRTSLKQASMIREQCPDTRVFILYKDLRSPAQFEIFYKSMQEDEGIFLTKGEVAEVTTDGSTFSVKATDSLLGEHIELKSDMVVLAAGMVPSTKVDDGILEKDEGDDAAEAADAKTDAAADEGDADSDAGQEPGAKILNLTYRQGTDLPTLKYGFPDSHYVCFPYETRRTAVYAAGCVRAPMDTLQTGRDAHGAALKAVQALELITRGEAVHPRAQERTEANFFLQRCTQCKRCTEECPFGSLDEDEKGTPKPNPTRCRRCGICLGACPERIVSFENYSPNMVTQMVKSIEIPDEEDEKPRYLAFMCENDAYPAFDMAGYKRLKHSSMVRIIPVRCIGAVNSVAIGDALSSGFDGIMMFGCKHGDDYQCHYIKGSELANTRMDNVRDKLAQLALEEERVQIYAIAVDEHEKIIETINDFVEENDDLGMNPFKGF